MMWIVILGAAAVVLASSSDKPEKRMRHLDADAIKNLMEGK